jgi:hypothetical protein
MVEYSMTAPLPCSLTALRKDLSFFQRPADLCQLEEYRYLGLINDWIIYDSATVMRTDTVSGAPR